MATPAPSMPFAWSPPSSPPSVSRASGCASRWAATCAPAPSSAGLAVRRRWRWPSTRSGQGLPHHPGALPRRPLPPPLNGEVLARVGHAGPATRSRVRCLREAI
eukprot:9498029-Pyramimonas_sp.AAC.1